MAKSSPVSPRDLALKEKKLQSIQEIEAAVNIMVRRLNDVYKYNRRDHDRLTEDVADVSGGESAVVCTAYLSSEQTDGSGGVQIPLDATLINTGSKFDAGNNRITITDAGNYLVSAQLCIASPASGQMCALRVKDSAGVVRAFSYMKPPYIYTLGYAMSVCMTLAMSAGDWLALYLHHDRGTDQLVRGDAELDFYSYPTFLSVVKV